VRVGQLAGRLPVPLENLQGYLRVWIVDPLSYMPPDVVIFIVSGSRPALHLGPFMQPAQLLAMGVADCEHFLLAAWPKRQAQAAPLVELRISLKP
jgi:hypothetical protein